MKKILNDVTMSFHQEKQQESMRTTKEEYGENLDENIADLVKRMKKKSYRPVPVRRTYIAKPGTNKKRPLGIPEYEDKIVQSGIAKILNAIYEPDLLDCSFGFRPNRNCHDALKILNVYIEKRYTNFIVDVDIKGFFDNVDHEWMMKFLKHRIADPVLLRIISKIPKRWVHGKREISIKQMLELLKAASFLRFLQISIFIMCLTYGLRKSCVSPVKDKRIW